MPRKKKVDETPLSLSELGTKYGGVLNIGSSDDFQYERISFGIPALDKLLGGGIPKKRLTLLTGQSNAGKSYLASQAVVNVQKAGGTAVWLDSEMSWDSGWMQKCGVDTDNVLLSQPLTGEEAFNTVRDLMIDGVDLIVLDSIAGLVPSAVHDEDFSYNPMAWQARLVNTSLPRLFPHFKHGSALMVINQVRSSMGPVALDAMPGGVGQVFFSHMILQAKRSGWIEENKEKVGFDIEVRLRKTKAGGMPFDSCTIPFRLDGGFDMIETWIREALDMGIVKQAGPWYELPEVGEKLMGLNNVKTFYIDNPDKFESLKETVGG